MPSIESFVAQLLGPPTARAAAWLAEVTPFLCPHVLGTVSLVSVDQPGCLLATRVAGPAGAAWRSARFPHAATPDVRVFDFGPPADPPGAVRFENGEIRVDARGLGPEWRLYGLVATERAGGAVRANDLNRLAGVAVIDAEVFAVCRARDEPGAAATPGQLLVQSRLAEGWRVAGAGPYDRQRQLGYAAAAVAAGRALFARQVWPDDGPGVALRADAGPACRNWLRAVAQEMDREVQGALATLIEMFRGHGR